MTTAAGGAMTDGAEDGPGQPPRGAGEPIPFPARSRSAAAAPAPVQAPATPPNVAFDRRELDAILGLYGRKVAEGEWRDYRIDFTREAAVFSIHRRASEVPLYRVEKRPALARRQGTYAVVAGTGLVLRRGHDLAQVLRVIDKPVRLVGG